MKRLIFILLIAAHAAVSARADVTATIEPKQATIGEPLELQIRVSGAQGGLLRLGEIPEPFELLSVDSSQARNGILQATVLAADTGTLDLSKFSVLVGGGEGAQMVNLPPLTVQIQSVVPDTAQAPKPIKPYREHPFRWRDLLAYWWVAAILALGAVSWWLWRRYFRRKPAAEAAAAIPLLPPYEEAVRNLIALREQKYPTRGMLKEFFSEYSYILRRYLERRYNFPALEMTTFDLELEFEDARYPADFRTRLLPSLRESDLVKFAKHVPDYRLCDGFVDLGFEMVERTKPRDEPAVAEEKAA